jgi:hypothetical protein
LTLPITCDSLLTMKTKTFKGTSVEIISLCGDNFVIVKVLGRNNLAQVRSLDLIKPEGELPPEFVDLQWYEKAVEEIVPAELENE